MNLRPMPPPIKHRNRTYRRLSIWPYLRGKDGAIYDKA